MSRRQFRHFGKGRPQELRARARVFPTKFERMEREKKARGSVSVAEIKSFEGLEKALGDLMLDRGTGPFHEEINYYNVLGLINSLKAVLRKEVLDLFDGKIGWECQCPPERRGAEMALIRVLIGKDWEDTNKLTFTIASKKELRSILEGEGGEKKRAEVKRPSFGDCITRFCKNCDKNTPQTYVNSNGGAWCCEICLKEGEEG